jgi:hypothetical protein
MLGWYTATALAALFFLVSGGAQAQTPIRCSVCLQPDVERLLKGGRNDSALERNELAVAHHTGIDWLVVEPLPWRTKCDSAGQRR